MVLTGCQQPPAPMTQMQTLVVNTADQIAGGDPAAATSSLDALEAEAAARLQAGEIDAAEADRIRAAIAVLRADLTALTTPSPEPETTTTETEPVEPTTPEVEPVQPTVTETDEADDSEDAPGNSGNTPGNDGETPGNDGETPGNSGNGNNKGKSDDKKED
jgi:hypothetical protein